MERKKRSITQLISQDAITNKILLLRGKKAMLDRDLAKLYGVTTGNLNKAVKRNIERFPEDFMFQLTKDEEESLRFQFGSLKRGQHAKYLSCVFTEQGVAMLSSVLRSKRAIQVNIIIMRVFVRLKEIISTHKELAYKLDELERKIEKHDQEIRSIFEAIRQLMAPPEGKRRITGFQFARQLEIGKIYTLKGIVEEYVDFGWRKIYISNFIPQEIITGNVL